MVEKKGNLKKQEAAPKRAEKTTMATPKCATEKKFLHLCSTKSIDVYKFKEQERVGKQTVELTTFRPDASSGKGNEGQHEEAHHFMKKKVTAK